MNRIWEFLRSLDWRVLFAVPVLAVLLGVANNLRVSEDQRVRWSGDRLEDASSETAHGARLGAWTSDFDAATNAAASLGVSAVSIPGSRSACSRSAAIWCSRAASRSATSAVAARR